MLNISPNFPYVSRRNVQDVPRGSVQNTSLGKCPMCPRRKCAICPRRNVRDVLGQHLAHSWRFFFKCIKVPKSEGPSRSLPQYEISSSICLSQNDSYVPTSLTPFTC